MLKCEKVEEKEVIKKGSVLEEFFKFKKKQLQSNNTKFKPLEEKDISCLVLYIGM